ncbi:4758_t:CDS:2, partial [Scutellospora calospora]
DFNDLSLVVELQSGSNSYLYQSTEKDLYDNSSCEDDKPEDSELREFTALNLAIANNSSQVFEELLQQFIEKQNNFIAQNNMSTESSEDSNSIYNITDPIQHKGKEQSTNKRYLSAIENYSL